MKDDWESLCKENMTSISKDDYSIQPGLTVTFGGEDIAQISLTSTQIIEWKEYQMDAPDGISKVLVGSGTEEYEAKIENGKATWISQDKMVAGETLLIRVFRTPTGPATLSLETMVVKGCQTEEEGTTTGNTYCHHSFRLSRYRCRTLTSYLSLPKKVAETVTETPSTTTLTTRPTTSPTTAPCADDMNPIAMEDLKSALPKNLDFGGTTETIVIAELTNVEAIVLFELSLSFNVNVTVTIYDGTTYKPLDGQGTTKADFSDSTGLNLDKIQLKITIKEASQQVTMTVNKVTACAKGNYKNIMILKA
ncbi:uncharacterized protein LOC121367209 [Gigantopelta aegis]|uniref:uncharacterized protein LOC121367209 n=1 Tax=Gigantopelta aegis TaxID=1735272 RepID=UPI001B88BAE0|nr:uncharacterized protein LOC121367209 [Gigantopelta aegis]